MSDAILTALGHQREQLMKYQDLLKKVVKVEAEVNACVIVLTNEGLIPFFHTASDKPDIEKCRQKLEERINALKVTIYDLEHAL